MSALVEVHGLNVHFGSLHAVRDVSFRLDSGDTLALVGESGSGKSVTAMALARLLPPAARVSGDIRFQGEAVPAMDARRLRHLRGRQIAYIFQEPTAALNPVFTVGEQIGEAIRRHFPAVRNVRDRVIEALARVGIREPEVRWRDYPHQMSGGMNQRVMIAMALACEPRLLVADEPTTALDVTIQAEIMELLARLQRDTGMAMLLITHNFGLVRGFARRVAVMYRGELVEQGDTEAVLDAPRHPYTRALLDCLPRLGERRSRLATIDHAALAGCSTE